MIEPLLKNLQDNPSNALVIVAVLYLILEGRFLKRWVAEKFSAGEAKFEKVDAALETHFGHISARIQDHITATEKRIDKHNSFDRRIGILEGRCAALHEERKA